MKILSSGRGYTMVFGLMCGILIGSGQEYGGFLLGMFWFALAFSLIGAVIVTYGSDGD